LTNLYKQLFFIKKFLKFYYFIFITFITKITLFRNCVNFVKNLFVKKNHFPIIWKCYNVGYTCIDIIAIFSEKPEAHSSFMQTSVNDCGIKSCRRVKPKKGFCYLLVIMVAQSQAFHIVNEFKFVPYIWTFIFYHSPHFLLQHLGPDLVSCILKTLYKEQITYMCVKKKFRIRRVCVIIIMVEWITA